MKFLFPRDDPSADVDSPYGYVPSKVACFTFVILFGLSCLLHAGQAIKYRKWFLIPTLVIGCLAEILGWAARLESAYNPSLKNPFLVQTAVLIIAPTFILAANFSTFKDVSTILGPKYSRFRPSIYSMFSLGCDVVALAIQAYGGAKAAVASGNDDLDGANHGAKIMLYGIGFQLAIILIYIALSTEFYLRYFYDRPFKGGEKDARGKFTIRAKLLVISLVLNALFILIRAIYRAAELTDGWTGKIIRTEVYFNVLDGAMIVLAAYTFNILNPGYLVNGKGQTQSRNDMKHHDTAWYSGVPMAENEEEALPWLRMKKKFSHGRQ